MYLGGRMLVAVDDRPGRYAARLVAVCRSMALLSCLAVAMNRTAVAMKCVQRREES